MMNHRRILFDPTDSGVLETLLKKKTREREEALLVAILGDAIECYQKYLFAKDQKGKKLFQEAEEWVLERNSDWFFSFDNICELLRLNPDYIRQGLLCWKATSPEAHRETKICPAPLKRREKKQLGRRVASTASQPVYAEARHGRVRAGTASYAPKNQKLSPTG